MTDATIISWTSPRADKGITSYRVTYNGKIIGDDRGYSTREAVTAEAIRRVEKIQRECLQAGRHADAIYRSGY